MTTQITVPALGESVTEATVAQWFKKVGDAVAADEAIAELETDKVTVEVYSAVNGTLESIDVPEGETVEVGTILGNIKEGAAPAASAEKPAEKPAAEPATQPAPAAAPVAPVTADTSQSPAVRRIAAENDLNTSTINGTGKGGRITKEDALNAVGNQAPYPYQAPDSNAGAPREERVKMSRLRQVIAKRLKEAQDTTAMLTTFNEVDMTAVMALRGQYKDDFAKKHGIKLGFMGFFTKAVIKALQEIPAVNAEIDGNEIVYKNHYDIGMAVGTEAGLVVPVVRDADQLSLAGVEQSIANLAKKARDGKLGVDDMQGGTFTITNGGVYGSLLSTPILNIPQSGILGLHKIEKRPVVVSKGGKDEIVIRPMMYLALSYDHRIIDGKEAVTFLVRVKESLEDPQRLLLDV